MRSLARGFWGGRVQSAIGVFLAGESAIASALPWALITSVDSLRDMTSWRPPAELADEPITLGRALRAPTAALQAAA